ncbi:MAG: hypothetical protein OXI87_25185 [Albidovulum sp.]|nr:hypothetical protein [Albidovulum sp.]
MNGKKLQIHESGVSYNEHLKHEPGERHEIRRTNQGGAVRRFGALLIMPKGPNGERRSADVVGCAVNVARIATGETEDSGYKQPAKRKGGLAGARARLLATTSEERRTIGKLAAEKRWKQ